MPSYAFVKFGPIETMKLGMWVIVESGGILSPSSWTHLCACLDGQGPDECVN